MPIIPSFRERRLVLPRNAGPGFMMDFLSSWGFRVVVLAFKNGVFEALDGTPKTPERLAEETGLDPKGSVLLLDALRCLGYVRRRRGRYTNTKRTRGLLDYMPAGIEYFEKIAFRDWNHLDDQVREGTGVRPVWFGGDWQIFNNGMIALTKMTLPEAVRRIRVPESGSHLLDLGGGHALYSIALCQRHPDLSATVFDIPQMEALAKEAIADARMEDRVSYQAGDFLADELPPSDVVLVFNVIHSKSEADNRAIIRRAAQCLRPNGQVLILDQFPTPWLGRIGYAYGTLMALSMLSAAGQRTYRIDEVKQWCRDAGLSGVKTKRILSSPGNALIAGSAPGRQP